MTSDRTYASGRSNEDAMAELARCAGTQFDPTVVGAFRAQLEADYAMSLDWSVLSS
jgi:HD-GYP domain-containing protein (c-di-GMP phosphodiesterase class II)